MTQIILRSKCNTKGSNTYHKRIALAFRANRFDFLRNKLEVIFYVKSEMVKREVLREISDFNRKARNMVDVVVNKAEAMK